MVTDINIVVKLPVRGEMVPDRMTHEPYLQLCPDVLNVKTVPAQPSTVTCRENVM